MKKRVQKTGQRAEPQASGAARAAEASSLVNLQQQVGNQAVQRLLRSGRADVMMKRKARTITFTPEEAGVIIGDPHAKTWKEYIGQYNDMIQTTIRNMRDAWQDGVNSFQTEMQFPSAGEAQPKIGEALLKAAAGELFGFLTSEIASKYPGVGTAIGVVKSLVTAVKEEMDRAEKAAQGMALGSFIVKMRTDVGNQLNDLATQRAKREDALRDDFKKNYLDKEGEFERVEFFKAAIGRLGALKIHSQPITRSLAETWIAENFKQEFNWLGQLITTGVIELKYEVSKKAGMRVYSYQHCKVAMDQGGRVAKAINRTYGGKPIDLRAFKCRKLVILENTDNRYQSEEGLLDENNNRIAGYLGAFGWYWGMLPRGLVVSKFEE